MQLNPDFLLYSVRPEWAILKEKQSLSVGHRAAFITSKSRRAGTQQEKEACVCVCVFPNQSWAIVQSAEVNTQLFKQVAWEHWSSV